MFDHRTLWSSSSVSVPRRQMVRLDLPSKNVSRSAARTFSYPGEQAPTGSCVASARGVVAMTHRSAAAHASDARGTIDRAVARPWLHGSALIGCAASRRSITGANSSPAAGELLPRCESRWPVAQGSGCRSNVGWVATVDPSDQDNRPVLLAVDDDPRALSKIAGELRRRYSSDYRIFCESSAGAAEARLRDMQKTGEEVAVVLADQWLLGAMGDTGARLLGCVRELHPRAKRVLLIEWGAWRFERTSEAIKDAMAR